MSSESLVVVAVLAVALALLLSAALQERPRVSRRQTRSFTCPFIRQDVTVEFAAEIWSSRPSSVEQCSAFPPASPITCQRLCLHVGDLEATAPVA